MEKISEQERIAGETLVKDYRAWHEWERKKGTGVDVIDIDIAPRSLIHSQNPFRSRSQVFDKLHEDREMFNDNTPDGQFLRAKIDASLVYIRSLCAKKPMPYGEYLLPTLGAPPGEIPDDVIANQFERTASLFSGFGYSFNREGWQKFFRASRLSWAAVDRGFSEAETKYLPDIRKTIGLNIDPKYQKEITREDAYWIFWASGDESGYKLRINYHERNQARWVKGAPEILAIHEVGGHLFQAEAWKDNIERGLINPACGVLTIPGSEQFNSEGMATTLPYLVPGLYDKMSSYGRFTLENLILNYWVYNKAHDWVNSQEQPRTGPEIVDYIYQLLPNETEDRIKRNLVDRRNHPRDRAYMKAYGIGSYYHRMYAEMLTDAQKVNLLQEFYTRPMTPSQVEASVQRKVDNRFLFRSKGRDDVLADRSKPSSYGNGSAVPTMV